MCLLHNCHNNFILTSFLYFRSMHSADQTLPLLVKGSDELSKDIYFEDIEAPQKAKGSHEFSKDIYMEEQEVIYSGRTTDTIISEFLLYASALHTS